MNRMKVNCLVLTILAAGAVLILAQSKKVIAAIRLYPDNRPFPISLFKSKLTTELQTH